MREAPRSPRRSRPAEDAPAGAGLREPEPAGPPPPPPSSSASSLLLLLLPPPRPPHSDITCSLSPALYCRRRFGPEGPARPVAPQSRSPPRPLTRTLHVSPTAAAAPAPAQAAPPPPTESARTPAPPGGPAPLAIPPLAHGVCAMPTRPDSPAPRRATPLAHGACADGLPASTTCGRRTSSHRPPPCVRGVCREAGRAFGQPTTGSPPARALGTSDTWESPLVLLSFKCQEDDGSRASNPYGPRGTRCSKLSPLNLIGAEMRRARGPGREAGGPGHSGSVCTSVKWRVIAVPLSQGCSEDKLGDYGKC